MTDGVQENIMIYAKINCARTSIFRAGAGSATNFALSFPFYTHSILIPPFHVMSKAQQTN